MIEASGGGKDVDGVVVVTADEDDRHAKVGCRGTDRRGFAMEGDRNEQRPATAGGRSYEAVGRQAALAWSRTALEPEPREARAHCRGVVEHVRSIRAQDRDRDQARILFAGLEELAIAEPRVADERGSVADQRKPDAV